MRGIGWTLATKLALAMTGLALIAVTGVTIISIRREQETFRDELEHQAQLLLNNVHAMSVDPLYLLDVDQLKSLVKSINRVQPEVIVQIYDRQGRVVADSTLLEGLPFDVSVDPFGERLINAQEIIYDWQPQTLEAGQPMIVGRERIGAVSITLPTTSLFTKMDNVRNQGMVAALIASIGSAFLSILISRTITNPLREMSIATTRIAEGDLSTRIELNTGDELAALAVSFNKMTDRLQELVESLNRRAIDLQHANEKAQEASRLKSEFLATMSHELRTPLNAIIGFSDMLLMGMNGPLNDKQRHKIQRLQENGKRLLGLVNDILDIARIEAGRLDLTLSPFEPRQLVERMAAQMAVLAESKKLDFITEVAPEVPHLLVGDEKHIEQIVVNLLSNAFKFTDTGSVTLSLAARENQWVITVKDTGVGIPPHAVDLIFEEFRQIDGTSTRVYKGSGLGLAITRQLVRVMKGQIKVDSVLGSGTAFVVTLPVIETPQPELVVERIGIS